ncbi:MAG: hypothetical protein ACYC8T_17035 [Myxococcaceae bacterium]
MALLERAPGPPELVVTALRGFEGPLLSVRQANPHEPEVVFLVRLGPEEEHRRFVAAALRVDAVEVAARHPLAIEQILVWPPAGKHLAESGFLARAPGLELVARRLVGQPLEVTARAIQVLEQLSVQLAAQPGDERLAPAGALLELAGDHVDGQRRPPGLTRGHGRGTPVLREPQRTVHQLDRDEQVVDGAALQRHLLAGAPRVWAGRADREQPLARATGPARPPEEREVGCFELPGGGRVRLEQSTFGLCHRAKLAHVP